MVDKNSTFFIFILGVIFSALGLGLLLQNLTFVFNAQKGIGHLESVIHHPVRNATRSLDFYNLSIKYLQPPLNKVVQATANNNTLWDASGTVTFLYNPNNTDEVKIPGFINLFAERLMFFVLGLSLFWGWFQMKRAKKNSDND